MLHLLPKKVLQQSYLRTLLFRQQATSNLYLSRQSQETLFTSCLVWHEKFLSWKFLSLATPLAKLHKLCLIYYQKKRFANVRYCNLFHPFLLLFEAYHRPEGMRETPPLPQVAFTRPQQVFSMILCQRSSVPRSICSFGALIPRAMASNDQFLQQKFQPLWGSNKVTVIPFGNEFLSERFFSYQQG